MGAVEGVWTPQAEVLCGVCHGPTFRPGMPSQREMPAPEYKMWCETVVEPDGRASGPTVCDRCKRPVVVDRAVAAYARLRDRLHDQNAAGAVALVAKLEQTGGMCSALSVRREGADAPVVFVAGLDDEEQFSVGLYAREDDVYEGEGEDCGTWATEDEAAGAIRNALLGGA